MQMQDDLFARLERDGYATTGRILSDAECAAIIATWNDPARFRSHVVMQRHGYGQGEYRYYNSTLPDRIQSLRESWYATLAPAANRWASLLDRDERFEPSHDAFKARCHAAGQRRS